MRKERGITLIALVVTIIVLLILAGVGIALLTGENGILQNARIATDNTKKAQAKEWLQIIILELQTKIYSEENRTATLEDFIALAHPDIQVQNQIPGSDGRLEYVQVIYQGFHFIIDKNLKIIEDYQQDSSRDVLVDYRVNSETIQEEKVPTVLKDQTHLSSDATLTNARYDESKRGIVFNGSSTYGVLDGAKVNLNFPITVTIVAKWESGNHILFSDIQSKVAIGTWNGEMLLTMYTKTSYYKIPNNFFQNEVNYITITYNQNEADTQLYINGEKMVKSSNQGSWSLGEAGTYLGRRNSGTYFKGIMYDFKIYNKLFTEQEILAVYQNQQQAFQNNQPMVAQEQDSLVLDYNGRQDKNEEKVVPSQIKSSNTNLYNVTLKNVEFNENKNGLVFNGTSSYGTIENTDFDITFPNTVVIASTWNNDQDSILFSHAPSKIGIGLWLGQMLLVNSPNSSLFYTLPGDFSLTGTTNYITITYGTDARDSNLYINGNLVNGVLGGVGWNKSETGTYLGRRNSGSYFKGTLYKLKIYSKMLTQEEIREEYQKDKQMYSNSQ